MATMYKLAAIGEPSTILALGKTFCTAMCDGEYDPSFEFPNTCVLVPAGNGEVCISVEVVTRYTEQTLSQLESVFKEKIFELKEIRTAKLYKKTV